MNITNRRQRHLETVDELSNAILTPEDLARCNHLKWLFNSLAMSYGLKDFSMTVPAGTSAEAAACFLSAARLVGEAPAKHGSSINFLNLKQQ